MQARRMQQRCRDVREWRKITVGFWNKGRGVQGRGEFAGGRAVVGQRASARWGRRPTPFALAPPSLPENLTVLCSFPFIFTPAHPPFLTHTSYPHPLSHTRTQLAPSPPGSSPHTQ